MKSTLLNHMIYLLMFVYLSSCIANSTNTDPQLFINSSEQHSDENPSEGEEENVFIDGSVTLSELCKIVNISQAECSCELLPFFCDGVSETIFPNTSEIYTANATYHRTKKITVAYASVTLVNSVFGILGNLAVLAVAYKQRKHLPSGRLHIAELAFVNFIFCFTLIINTIPLYWTNKWIYHIFLCKLIRGGMEFASLLTIGFVLIIAVERYFLISKPLYSKCTEENFRHSLVFVNITICLATVVPYIIGLGIDTDDRCIVFSGKTAHMNLPYNWFVVVVFSAIPVILTTCLYIKIARLLSSQPSGLRHAHSSTTQLHMDVINRRIICITVVTLLAFILCTLPTRVISIYMATVNYQVSSMELYMTLAFISYFTYPLQATLNPILYSTIAKEWRKEMRRTIKRSRVTSSSRSVIRNEEEPAVETNF